MEKKIIILSGELMERSDLGLFCIDPETVKIHKPRLILDYNHIEEEVIGFVDDIHVEDDKLVGTATIESVREGDRAAEIIARIEEGTPYEISPTVMLNELGVETKTIREADVEFTVYHNVPLRGVSICPYGTDKLTTILSFTSGGLRMKRTKKRNGMTRLAAEEEIKEAVETEVVEGGDEKKEELEGEVVYDAFPLLEQFIAAFGLEKGVEFYRRGLTLEEAEAEDYAELKAARLAAEDGTDVAGAIEDVGQIEDNVAGADAEEAIVEGAQEKVDEAAEEKTGLKAIRLLAREMKALTAEMVKLKALSVRGGNAIESNPTRQRTLTAQEKFARKIERR